MGLLYKVPQFKTTTLSVAGGIDSSQTADIVLTNTDNVDISEPGIICIDWSTTLDTDVAEFITYTSITAGKELQGVTRGAEDYSAKAHNNGAVIAFIVSESHINGFYDAITNGYWREPNTVAYASGTTFTVAGIDRTSVYSAGRIVKFSDGTFGVVTTSAFVTDTTVTVTGTVPNPCTSVDVGIQVLGKANLVLTDGTQTLTNKTITAPVLGGSVTGTYTLAGTPTITAPTINTSVAGTAVLDEDDMVSDSATKVATQQSIKAYVDGKASTFSSKKLYATRDLTAVSGDVAYTAIGFTPTSIHAQAQIDGANAHSIGFVDSAKAARCNWVLADGKAYGRNTLISLGDTTSAMQEAVVKSYDADGFTLTWTKTGSPGSTCGISFICYK